VGFRAQGAGRRLPGTGREVNSAAGSKVKGL